MTIPSNIGRYEIERELGAGGMGEVYLARDPYINRQVAIKVLPRPRERESQLFRARFEREARIIAAMEHPAIVPIHDFGYHNDQPYIVMRYMAGGTLKERIHGEPLSTTETIRIFRQLSPALDYMHRQGIVHRDLKPGNILFDLAGNAYISDFGIAKISETTTDLTGGATIGTPAYMSPEQAKGTADLDCRSDVYSMGVVVFEILTGKVPFKADTPISQALAHITEPVPDIVGLRSDLSRPYQALIYKAMAKDREERYGAVSDLLLAMEKAEQDRYMNLSVTLEEQKVSSEVPAGVTPTPQETHKQKIPRWAWLGGGGVVVFGLCLGIWWLASIVAGQFMGGEPTQLVTLTKTTPLAATDTPAPTDRPTQVTAATDTPRPATPTEAALPVMITENGHDMALVPAGSFEMGFGVDDALAICQMLYEPFTDNTCSRNLFTDEEPIHNVYLDDYYMDLYEVTNAQYADFLNAQGNQAEEGVSWLDAEAPGVRIHQDNGTWRAESGFENHPAIEVSWYGAKAYCEWRNAALPTEAQWEKAARGPDSLTYPWGNNFDGTLLNFCDANCTTEYANTNFDDGYADTAPVGSYPGGVSPYGLYDMAGNVWEWVVDRYDDAYYGTLADGVQNPMGPLSGEFRVRRGGSWGSGIDVFSAVRRGSSPSDSLSGRGFRCAR